MEPGSELRHYDLKNGYAHDVLSSEQKALISCVKYRAILNLEESRNIENIDKSLLNG